MDKKVDRQSEKFLSAAYCHYHILVQSQGLSILNSRWTPILQPVAIFVRTMRLDRQFERKCTIKAYQDVQWRQFEQMQPM